MRKVAAYCFSQNGRRVETPRSNLRTGAYLISTILDIALKLEAAGLTAEATAFTMIRSSGTLRMILIRDMGFWGQLCAAR